MKKLLGIALLGFLFLGCTKTKDTVPYVRVNLVLQKGDPRYNELSTGGGVVFISGYGVAGLIIYRRGDGNYVAYDQCSSYQPEKRCKVVLDNTGLQVEDPCSGSKFLLQDGSPVKAPATRSLRTYTVIQTQFEIQVTN
jgi:nitrite reductase/ring-hydroxylating ferredoxin subunit